MEKIISILIFLFILTLPCFAVSPNEQTPEMDQILGKYGIQNSLNQKPKYNYKSQQQKQDLRNNNGTCASSAAEKSKSLVYMENRKADFQPYIEELQRVIKQNWTPIKTKNSEQVIVIFKIDKEGYLKQFKILTSSGDKDVDNAAVSAVKATFPFKPLPNQCVKPTIDVIFTFNYNIYGDKVLNNMPEVECYSSLIQYFTESIKLNPNDYFAYIDRGANEDKSKDYKNAIKDYTKAMGLNSNNYEAYLNRGLAKGKLGDCNGAIKDLTKAIQLNPNSCYAYYIRGLIKYNIKDYNGANEDNKKSKQLQLN